MTVHLFNGNKTNALNSSALLPDNLDPGVTFCATFGCMRAEKNQLLKQHNQLAL